MPDLTYPNVWEGHAKCHASLIETGVENVGVWGKAMMRHGTIWVDRSPVASDDERIQLHYLRRSSRFAGRFKL